ncbi:MAG: nitrous oxide reductase family maturation protein NosD [Myxococcota bacterium]
MRGSAAGGAAALVVGSVWILASAAEPQGSGGDEALPSLQAWVDAASEGEVLRPPPGRYAGPVVIRRPLVLDGRGEVHVDGGGRGTVIRLETDGAEVRRLHIHGSGESHDGLDAGVQVRGNGNRIVDNVIEDSLFGVDLKQADGNRIEGNRIGSKALPLGVRGDGIRLWYSRDNQVLDNRIEDVRDVVVWYSGGNRIAGNTVTGGRYGLHFMYSEANQVEGNRYDANMVGVFLMYSDGVVLRRNHIRGALGATGMGIGFKESSNVGIEENSIVYCAKGIYLDTSPYEPDSTNRILGNRIAYNGVGIVFHNDWHGNVFQDNQFDGNFTQVSVRGGGGAARNRWRGNRWDDYRGFDRDGDGRGDTPYELYSYADRIWQERPEAAFFRGSPLFEAIDFLDRLAPFSEPTLVLRDESPRFEPPAEGAPWPM